MNTALNAPISEKQHDLNDDIQYINGLLKKFNLEEFPFEEVFSASSNRSSNLLALQHKARVCFLLIQLLHSKQVLKIAKLLLSLFCRRKKYSEMILRKELFA